MGRRKQTDGTRGPDMQEAPAAQSSASGRKARKLLHGHGPSPEIKGFPGIHERNYPPGRVNNPLLPIHQLELLRQQLVAAIDVLAKPQLPGLVHPGCHVSYMNR